MPTSTVYFISGANRGLGFSFVKQSSSDSNNLVIASARNPDKATELQEWAKEHTNTKIVKLDVSNEESIASLPDQVFKFTDKINVLISNAGLIDEKTRPILETPASAFSKLFTVNSIGPILLVGALKPFLSKSISSKTIFISSFSGSITGNEYAYPAYGASKAALNYYMRVLSTESKVHTFVAIHPGFVDTDMAKEVVRQDTSGVLAKMNKLTPDESAFSILNVVKGLSIKDSGSFLDYKGITLPF